MALAACGGGDRVTGAATSPDPVVSSIVITPGAITIAAGASSPLTATPRDATGKVIASRAVSWTASGDGVVGVSQDGVVTGITPGSATVSATADGITANATVTVESAFSAALLEKPFAGEYHVANFMDHDFPYEFIDTNGRFTTFWGEMHASLGGMIDGHSGYDFGMPTGTPLLATADGIVTRATTTNTPFYCPLLGRDVSDQATLDIQHALPGGVVVVSRYLHLSRIDVQQGQVVSTGQQVGLSGNTGCSTGPHLHFMAYRTTQTKTGFATIIDPYGWGAPGADPWTVDSRGATSLYLWKPGRAPRLWRELASAPNPFGSTATVAITRIVFEGIRDDLNPNNEFVELTLDPRFAPSASLYGFVLRGDVSGLNYPLPSGITLTTAAPTLRIYTGPGANVAGTIHLGRATGIWSNDATTDCARLVAPGGAQYRYSLGGPCSAPLAVAVASPLIRMETIRELHASQEIRTAPGRR